MCSEDCSIEDCSVAVLLRVTDSILVDGEHGFILGQARRIVNLAHTRVAASFAQAQTSCGCVRHDVAADGLLGISHEHLQQGSTHTREKEAVRNMRCKDRRPVLDCATVIADRSSIDRGHDLIRDDDGHSKLVRNAQQRSQESRQVHLTRRQLTATAVVRAIQSRGAVDHNERVATLGEHGRCLD